MQRYLAKRIFSPDLSLPGTQFITYESVLLPSNSVSYVSLDQSSELPLIHRTTSYTHIDAMLESMLFEVQKQEKLFGLDFDLIEPEQQCSNSLELLPSTDALIEVPIKKIVKKRKIYETTQQILVNQDEPPPDLITFTETPPSDTYQNYEDIDFPQSLDDISKSIETLITTVEADESKLLTARPEDEYLEKPYTYKIDFQRANTASSESLSDYYPDSWNDPNEQRESSVEDDYDFMDLHPVQLRDSRTGNEIWWEGTYRNLSIVPEEDEENQSLLSSCHSNKTYTNKQYTPLVETKPPELGKDTSFEMDDSTDYSSSRASSSSEGSYDVSQKLVKAEVKLMVKTTDGGKEAIEIRSVREFMDNPNKTIEDDHKNSKEKSQTLPSKLSEKLSNLTQKFSGFLDKKKSSSYSPLLEKNTDEIFNGKSSKPSFTLQNLFVRNLEPDNQNNSLAASKELSKSKTELLTASNQRFPLEFIPNTPPIDDSQRVDLFANIPFYPCYKPYPDSDVSIPTQFVSNPFTENRQIPEAYCDWLHQKEDDVIGKVRVLICWVLKKFI